MASTKSKGLIAIVFLIFIFFILFVLFGVFTFKSFKDKTDSDLVFDTKDAPIGVVEVNGVIMKSKDIVDQLHGAEKDKEIKAIILRINSPGGAVGPTQEIYEEILRIDKDKPVYSSMGSIAASGGYYVAAATRKIFANAGTLTGSIGVIMQFMDMSKLYEWAKVSPETIKAGRYKDVGSPSRAMTMEERELLNAMISKVHDQFKRDIGNIRKKKIVGDLNDHAQGQIFSGEEALERGLVDELAGLWEAGRRIHKDLEIKEDFKLKFFKKKKKMKFFDMLSDIEETTSHIKEVVGRTGMTPLFLYEGSSK